ncbi:MAG: hypothetical protein O9294_06545 [Cytophagales bacterium]|nr:hypothetical protein [Cytophagales bacterium]
MKQKILLIFLILTITSCSTSLKENSKELTLEERYPLPWSEPTSEQFIAIGQTLIANEIVGCGEYYIRPSSQDENEFLVGCTPDGKIWKYSIVWTSISKIEGPFYDSSINSPQY